MDWEITYWSLTRRYNNRKAESKIILSNNNHDLNQYHYFADIMDFPQVKNPCPEDSALNCPLEGNAAIDHQVPNPDKPEKLKVSLRY